VRVGVLVMAIAVVPADDGIWWAVPVTETAAADQQRHQFRTDLRPSSRSLVLAFAVDDSLGC
jgi:hypothetical protein